MKNYYDKNDVTGECFTASEFMDEVAGHLEGILMPYQVRYLFVATKYPLRAGRKDPWRSDARKFADYICKMVTGQFLEEHAADRYDREELCE